MVSALLAPHEMGSDDDITEPSEGAGDAINDDIGREEAILGPE